ncbi:MAG: 4'-phosphopantetheinyl transferase family protein, partial [Isosphaeraceae bacterium]
WQPGEGLAALRPGQTYVFRVGLGPRQETDQLERLSEWPILSAEEQARALRFVRVRDGRRFVLCRGALRLILAQIVHVDPRDVAFRFGPGGKPELLAKTGQVDGQLPHFNVSHSDDLALVALCLDRELGVDLERGRSISQADRIVESYFTAAEQAQFLALGEPGRDEAFIRGWTRKEAILKAKGVGLAGLASGYETMFGTEPLSGHFRLASPLPRVQEWTLWEAAPGEDYVAALAVAAASC